MENNGERMEMEVCDRREGALGELRVIPDDVICGILGFLSPRDVARLACVSSVMYIFCNEEPLWMSLCLRNFSGLLQYKGSWKRTALLQENVIDEHDAPQTKPLHFEGFYSMFLYRRMYRCFTSLNGFYVDNGNVERKSGLSLEEFLNIYDGKKPVLLNGLADTWPARTTWTLDQLLLKYGDTPFKISQRTARKIRMKLEDYVSYIKVQHDEEPLYIFDEKFGEAAPDLLKDYEVPHLFQEDLFDVLDTDERPSFRWLIIGPERSGASWHVDPALTSAWNTLLCGRKRWALYPPGRVPLGVTVHVNEEDGDVNIESPSSLQWWLEYYPLLPDVDKPIECTQLPGETIFVPSGWWHCVLNLETTVAVTQNFVNSTNFEFVCLDMAPGYRHKGVCRAGFLAVDDGSLEDVDEIMSCGDNGLSSTDVPGKEKRLRMHHANHESAKSPTAKCCDVWNHEHSYDINFLSQFLDDDRDHYNALWSSSNCIGQREMRGWLSKLWSAKPGMRDLIWKGACLALNAGKWFECINQICHFHGLPTPKDDEKLPVGTGSNPVYLIADYVIKIYVEGGLEPSLYGLGTELEFYDLLCKGKSVLKEHVPDILASGFIALDNGLHSVIPWDGKGIPSVLSDYDVTSEKYKGYRDPFGLWSKMVAQCKRSGLSKATTFDSKSPCGTKKICPYVVTRRCRGKIFAELRESLSLEDGLSLASFLGEQLQTFHLLPLPRLDNSALSKLKQELSSPSSVNLMEVDFVDCGAADWEIFLHILAIRRKDVVSRLTGWGHPIPSSLIDKAEEYLPDDFEKLLSVFEGETCSWIHSDIMDDNIYLEPLNRTPALGHIDNASVNGSLKNGEAWSWKPSHILDFSDLSIGDPILDLIPIHLDVFKGDTRLLKQLLSSYKLPLLQKDPKHNLTDKTMKFRRPSYRAMCYCLVHEENVLGAIFSIWEHLRKSKSWEEVEEEVWGVLNDYTQLS